MPFKTNKSRAWFWANHPEAKRDYEAQKQRERREQLDWAMKHRGDETAEHWLREFYPNIARQRNAPAHRPGDK